MLTELNEQAFEEAMTACGVLKFYKAIVILPNIGESQHFIDELERIHRDNPIPYLDSWIRCGTFAILRFHNGSSMEITCVETVQNGDRYHRVLISPAVTDNEFKEMAATIVKPYEFAYREIDLLMEDVKKYGFIGVDLGVSTENIKETIVPTLKHPRDYLVHAMGEWADVKVTVQEPEDCTEEVMSLDDFLNQFKINTQ